MPLFQRNFITELLQSIELVFYGFSSRVIGPKCVHGHRDKKIIKIYTFCQLSSINHFMISVAIVVVCNRSRFFISSIVPYVMNSIHR